MKKYFIAFLLVGIMSAGIGRVIPVEARTVPTSGSLIRGTTLSSVYYMGADGFRYVFPNEKTYFTWYSDFATVTQLSDADLGRIQIGGNVTYRPGERLIKIDSDPRTYAIAPGGVLRWVSSEAIATSLYGATWNSTKTDDIADGFFTNYTIGDPIMTANDFSVMDAKLATTSINRDKDLAAYPSVVITDDNVTADGDDASEVAIKSGETVLFVNSGSSPHTATGDDGTWGTGTMQPQEFFVHRFTSPGTYEFYDSYDETLTGTIVVR